MQKIKSLFIRDKENPRLVTREVEPECQWVLDGEGVATVKWDGSACLVRDGKLYRRHQLKEGHPMPPGWLHWSFDPEQKTGHGWMPVGDGPQDDYHREANLSGRADGTYELCGPKVQGNPHRFMHHNLVPHRGHPFDASRFEGDIGFDSISLFLEARSIEGIVWHHEDGRMAKIKRSDFGFDWPVRTWGRRSNAMA